MLYPVLAINSDPTFRGPGRFHVFPLPLHNRQASRFINCCFRTSFILPRLFANRSVFGIITCIRLHSHSIIDGANG